MLYKDARQKTLIMDNFKCRICEDQTNVVVHHIIPRDIAPDLLYESWNLITLCRKHHNEIHKKLFDIGIDFDTLSQPKKPSDGKDNDTSNLIGRFDIDKLEVIRELR